MAFRTVAADPARPRAELRLARLVHTHPVDAARGAVRTEEEAMERWHVIEDERLGERDVLVELVGMDLVARARGRREVVRGMCDRMNGRAGRG